MKKIQDAKKAYNEIEIPSELGERVASAIERSAPKKKGAGFYVKVLVAPVAVCAAICIAIGMNGVPSYAPPATNTEATDTIADAEVAAETPKMASVTAEEDSSAAPEAANAPIARIITYDDAGATEKLLPFDEPIELWLYSGAGAWGTKLVLNNDGTFFGNFHDSNGDTVYLCDFSGSFTEIEKKDDLTYSLKLSQLLVVDFEEYVEDGVRYIKSMPYGLEDEEFVFYLPDKPLSALTDEERYWWRNELQIDEPETLSSYGLINKTTSQGFFGR